jgi:hypothetical protein
MKKTNHYLDTEFTGLHKNTTLISLGIVSECGKTFYAEFSDFDKSQLNEWLTENVIANLRFKDHKKYEDDHYKVTRSEGNAVGNNIFDSYSFEMRGNKEQVKTEPQRWFNQFDKIEIWSDCLAYDWVLFCDIFGGAFDIPKNIYYIPFDLSSLFYAKGIGPDINRSFCWNKRREGK